MVDYKELCCSTSETGNWSLLVLADLRRDTEVAERNSKTITFSVSNRNLIKKNYFEIISKIGCTALISVHCNNFGYVFNLFSNTCVGVPRLATFISSYC